MKNFALALCLMLLSIIGLNTHGQARPQTIVIQGNVKNFTTPSWNFLLTDLFEDQMIVVPVKSDGSFTKTIKLSETEDIYLYLNDDALVIFAEPGDTLKLSWDNKAFKNTFKINTGKYYRQQELDLMLDLYTNYRQPFMDLGMAIHSKKLVDSIAFKQIQQLFASQVNTIIKYPITQNSQKILYDAYFQNKYLLSMLNKHEYNYHLKLQQYVPEALREKYDVSYFSNADELLNEPLFEISCEYREFVWNQVRMRAPFTSFTWAGEHQQLNTDYTLTDCYKGMAFLDQSDMMRDWYLVKTLIEGFKAYKFATVEQDYLKLLPEIKTPFFKNKLIAFYNNIQILKPGQPAPSFTLKDANGATVSLSDYKGKVIYIDFWGVGCGPCMYDIKNYATKMHEKYKDIVYLNICVDVGSAEWKKSLGELKLQGINLLAEGWAANPVCKAYHVDGIPHYVIVDARGNIVNNNAPRMSELIGDGVLIERDKNGNNELEQTILANK